MAGNQGINAGSKGSPGWQEKDRTKDAGKHQIPTAADVEPTQEQMIAELVAADRIRSAWEAYKAEVQPPSWIEAIRQERIQRLHRDLREPYSEDDGWWMQLRLEWQQELDWHNNNKKVEYTTHEEVLRGLPHIIVNVSVPAQERSVPMPIQTHNHDIPEHGLESWIAGSGPRWASLGNTTLERKRVDEVIKIVERMRSDA